MNTVVDVFDEPRALIEAAARRLVDTMQSAMMARGRALVVLTGGSNGIALLEQVGDLAQLVDWSKVHLFWGDERYVPENDDERNDKQAREALLDRIDIPSSHVHAMPASDGEFGSDLAAAALAYEQLLAANAESGALVPDFDVHLLGMGPEGHINSLFPETAAVRETTRMVVPVDNSPKPPPQRITLTLPAVQRSREVWLLVSGASKADAAAAAIGGAPPASVPAAGAVGSETTRWLLDRAAASKLPG
ncbi:MAG: 6-phosphogluconolactonase [Mycobacterium sp.]|nr:6-phosphogluconolactonase [Mycobacterium sp.]